MQSILVESTAAFDELHTHVTDVEQNAGAKLRSVETIHISPLYIDAAINDRTNRTLLLPQAENTDWNNTMNIQKVFLKENLSYQVDKEGKKIMDYAYPISVYTLSQEGDLMDIQLVSGEREIVPIGISTLQQGTVRLSFEGITSFLPGYEIYLVDTGKGMFPETINLAQTPFYEFEKQGEDVFLNERLYLKITPVGTEINTLLPERKSIRVSYHGNRIRLTSTTGEKIQEVSVTDLQGKVLFVQKEAGQKEIVLHSPLSAQGFYLIHCTTESSKEVFKVYY
ncbi:MAG: T9SS type A sorting domain-containing protein [Candidatus Azobacteroides sp.]|nr:T9SS type A sorting domain-containing protein [Candidatus Azobacteroides sp.]